MADRKDWIKVGPYLIDPRLLETRPTGRCVIQQCRAMCCGYGVWVDLGDASRIIQEADVILPNLPQDRQDISNWFDGEVKEDADFPTGWKVGTNIAPDPTNPVGTHCVFQLPDHKCGLQVASVAAKRHPWDLKPFYCALYPVTLLDGTLQLDEENEIYREGGTCQSKTGVPVPLYILLKDELVLALGENGYQELCAKARELKGGSR
ncbi:MAG: DUF3109 family protein [SAR202 cluster bacterium]|nr:DUF3109 family protein [SAR202 cluster bacterium]